MAAFFAGPLEIPRAHAVLTGLVCLADPTTASGSAPCPASPPKFDGPVGEQIRIGLFLQGSNTTNGFSISLQTDHTILSPYGVDLAGTILPGPARIVFECISGIIKVGSSCPTTDTIDTLDFAAAAAPGKNVTAPATGLLFTAIYNITGRVPTGGIPVGFQTGCTGTSVTGLCLVISNGTLIPVPETTQAGSFDNTSPPPFVLVSASPVSIGPVFPATTNMATITATAMSGYPGLAMDSVNFTAQATTGLTATPSPIFCMTLGTSCSVSLVLSASAVGNYFATVFGTYATRSASGNDTLAGAVTLSVVVTDFSIAVSPTSISFGSGSTGSATVTLIGQNGFVGNVTLSTGLALPAGLTISYTPTRVALTGGSGSSATSIAIFSASPSVATTYHALIKATSGTRSKTSSALTIMVNLNPDFAIVASPTLVSQMASVVGISTITVSTLNGFAGSVALTNSTSSSNLTCSLSPTGVTTAGPSTLSCTGSKAGAFIAIVTGISGSLSHIVPVTFNITDFGLEAKPASIGPINAGSAGTSSILVSSLNGFSGTVSLAVTGSTGLNAMVSQNSVTVPGSVMLTVSALVSGNYTATVKASIGTLSHSIKVNVTIVDFSVSPNPSTLNIGQGHFQTSNVAVMFLNGFSGSVALRLSVPLGLTATLDRTIVNAAGSSILNITASTSITFGTYKVNVTGTSGSLVHNATAIVNVVPTTFGIMSSTVGAVDVGFNVTSTITLISEGQFAGVVSLSVASPSGITASLDQSSIALSSGGTRSAILTVKGSAAGMFGVNVTGVSGSLQNKVSVTVMIVDFTVSASPTSFHVDAGFVGVSTITVSALNGFSGTVTLSLTHSTGLTAKLSAGSVVGSGSVTLSVNASAFGNYVVRVSGTDGSLSRGTGVISVAVVDFFVLAAPSFVGPLDVGAAGKSTITITPENGFANTLSFSVSYSAPGVSATPNSTSLVGGGGVSLTIKANGASDYTVTFTSTDGSLAHSVILNVHAVDFTIADSQGGIPISIPEGSSVTIAVNATALNGFIGTVGFSAKVTSGLPAAFAPTAIFTPQSLTLSGDTKNTGLTLSVGPHTPPGPYTINYTAASADGLLSESRLILLNVPSPDFTIVSSQPSPVNPGSTGTSTVTVTAKNGFNGTVTFSATISPSTGMSCSLSRTSVALLPGGSNTTVATCIGSPGSYGLTVSGVASALFAPPSPHPSIVTYVVTDFSISRSPGSITVTSGVSGSSTITITGLNGFTGTVSLSVSESAGLTATISAKSVSGSGTVTLTVSSSAPGAYQATVTGSSGGVTHTTTVSVTVNAASGPSTIFGFQPPVFYSIVGIVIVAVLAGVVAVFRLRKRSV